ncbi:hypothetical protein HAX54_048145, partial [Datura stramonium]|nr:hypothetical protein [Datura stramonium]
MIGLWKLWKISMGIWIRLAKCRYQLAEQVNCTIDLEYLSKRKMSLCRLLADKGEKPNLLRKQGRAKPKNLNSQLMEFLASAQQFAVRVISILGCSTLSLPNLMMISMPPIKKGEPIEQGTECKESGHGATNYIGCLTGEIFQMGIPIRPPWGVGIHYIADDCALLSNSLILIKRMRDDPKSKKKKSNENLGWPRGLHSP